MIVMKFGGTSVKDADAFRNVTEIIKSRINKKPLIVVSALAGVTNLLIDIFKAAADQNSELINSQIIEIKRRHYDLIEELFSDRDGRQLFGLVDAEIEKLTNLINAAKTIKVRGGAISHAVMSIGEILSSNILNTYLNKCDLKCGYLDSREVIVIKNNGYEPVPDLRAISLNVEEKVKPLIKGNQCIVAPGFIGLTEEGEPATLGRDGSDYTASLLCAALNGEALEIWSDVEGILTADPTIIRSAKPLKVMSFDEACELAYFGARVLHPATIQPVLEKNIPVKVLNTKTPDSDGTLIIKENKIEHSRGVVKSIAYKEGITLLNIESSELLLSPKISEDVLAILSKHGKKVYAISKSATKLSVTIENHSDDLETIIKEITAFGQVTAEKEKVIVSVVGEKMRGHSSINWKILQLLDKEEVRVSLVSQFSSQISLMFIIDEYDIDRTVKLLHEKFIN